MTNCPECDAGITIPEDAVNGEIVWDAECWTLFIEKCNYSRSTQIEKQTIIKKAMKELESNCKVKDGFEIKEPFAFSFVAFLSISSALSALIFFSIHE